MAMVTADRLGFDPADWIAHQSAPDRDRPWVTLSYAQSLDGCIALDTGKPLELSSPESMRLTHRLRAVHDAILVGIGTVLEDDPQLTVRLESGSNPQPVILDSSLRTPLTARLMKREIQRPWIICAEEAEASQVQRVGQAGPRVTPVRLGVNDRLDLVQALRCLHAEGIKRVMVEGGSQVIQAFLSSGMVDYVGVTISPRWLGGLAAVNNQSGMNKILPRINEPSYLVFRSDVIVSGRVTL